MSDPLPDVSRGRSWNEIYDWFNKEAKAARATCASLSTYVATLDELALTAEQRYISSQAHKRELWDSIEENTEMETGMTRVEVNGDPVLGARAKAERDQYHDGLEKLRRRIPERKRHHRERFIQEAVSLATPSEVPTLRTDFKSPRQNSDFWRTRHTEFDALAELQGSRTEPTDEKWMKGYCFDSDGPDKFIHFRVAGGDSQLISRFEDVATRCAIALKCPPGTRPVHFWMHCLREDLCREPCTNAELIGDGIVQDLLGSSASFCLRIATRTDRAENDGARGNAPAMVLETPKQRWSLVTGIAEPRQQKIVRQQFEQMVREALTELNFRFQGSLEAVATWLDFLLKVSPHSNGTAIADLGAASKHELAELAVIAREYGNATLPDSLRNLESRCNFPTSLHAILRTDFALVPVDLRQAAASAPVEPEGERYVSPENPPAPAEPVGAIRQFKRSGDFWLLRFDGEDDSVSVRNLIGLTYIADLLGSPDRAISCLEMQARGGASIDAKFVGDQGNEDLRLDDPAPQDLLDDIARKQYKERLESIEEEISEAESNNDRAKVEVLKTEKDMIVSQLESAIGIRGRPRPFTTPIEKARKAVSNAINNAIEAIGKHHSQLAEHFRTRVEKGTSCRYNSDGIDWEL